ncbi:MAG: alpha/beta hydrolase-fold protein [Planctomycetaceae bacterium]
MPSPSRPHWSTIEVGGHACELFSPPDPRPSRAVVFLHGVDGRRLEELPSLRDLVEAARIPVVGPRAGRSWWLDRIVPAFDAAVSPERFLVDAVRAEIERTFDVRPPGIALVGVGMGGQGALRLAYRHPAVFPVAAAIAPAIDFHQAMRDAPDRDDGDSYDTLWQIYGDVERARQDTAILHVHPLNWPRHQCFASDPADTDWHDGAARLHSKLVALGIPHLALLEPRGGGHPVAFEERMAPDVMRFVLEALDAESRRSA